MLVSVVVFFEVGTLLTVLQMCAWPVSDLLPLRPLFRVVVAQISLPVFDPFDSRGFLIPSNRQH